MTQAPERTTTALISASLCRAAKIYAAEHGTSIRAIIEESVSEWLRDRSSRGREDSYEGNTNG
jgi:hypothetical protein